MAATRFLLAWLLARTSLADTNANCHYEQIKGKWTFYYTDGGLDNTVMCDDSLDYKNSVEMELRDINVVQRTDAMNTNGWFTLIYNQGFEIIIDERKWFAFFSNNRDPGVDTYDCDSTYKGWVHDTLSNDWACFHAAHEKINSTTKKQPLHSSYSTVEHDFDIVKRLGMFQETEKEPHPSLKFQKKPRTGPILNPKTYEQILEEIDEARHSVMRADKTGNIPQEFEWNDYGMVSPVKDQAQCGSCYAFASVGMFEARARVQTNGAWQPLFSDQDVTACSQYSQGCSGGFPYLISKYGQDWGLVEESCGVPYNTSDSSLSTCATDSGCFRHKISDYGYVGNYYGGATEYLMRQEIYQNGPIAVSLDAGGLHDYDNGIWIQPSSGKFYDPFEVTTHVVVITGWGWEDTDQGRLPFWNVKNSWGTDFGEAGYFRIIRGIDNANIESLPAKCTMIPPINV